MLTDEHLNSYNSPFKFNEGQAYIKQPVAVFSEGARWRAGMDDETGNYYYGARYYNPKTSIWLSVDPLVDMYPGWSPYNYCMLNPVMLVDPTGMGAEDDNPIYGTNGKLRGITNTGLKGEAIVYDGDFENGVSTANEIIDAGGQTLDSYMDVYPDFKYSLAGQILMADYINLPKRADFDGILTIPEARDWNINMNGKDAYIDIGKMGFENTCLWVNDFGSDNKRQVNFFPYFNIHPFNEDFLWMPTEGGLGVIYGTLRIDLVNRNTGEIILRRGFNGNRDAFDTFDFKQGLFKIVAGNGTPFNFIGYGKAYIKTTDPNSDVMTRMYMKNPY